MFTVCPKCALTLVVTAADLRVAQGYVRCGRCSSVFNALAQLSEDRQGPGVAPEPAPPPASSARGAAPAGAPGRSEPPAPRESGADADSQPLSAAAADDESIPEDALEFNPETTDAASVFVEAPPNPQWTAATGSFKAMVTAHPEPVATGQTPQPAAANEQVDVEIDASFLSDIVRGSPVTPPSREAANAARKEAQARAAPPAQARGPAPPKAAPLKDSAPPAARRPTRAPPASGATAKQNAAPAALVSHHTRPTAPALVQALGLQPDDLPDGAQVRDAQPTMLSPRGNLPWVIGAALLALALIAQLIDHHRDALATNPRLTRPLTALYGALGVALVPRWDLHAYDVRQLGATVAPGSAGEITVRASIRNAGPRPQPLPLLRVTLQDRFGTPLASRDVQPRDYLPRAVPATSLLGADQRIDAEMAFVDPGSNAVGFELDACLPVSGGGIACANDASGR